MQFWRPSVKDTKPEDGGKAVHWFRSFLLSQVCGSLTLALACLQRMALTGLHPDPVAQRTYLKRCWLWGNRRISRGIWASRSLSAIGTTPMNTAAAPGRIQAAFPERSGRVPHPQLHHKVPAVLHNVGFRSRAGIIRNSTASALGTWNSWCVLLSTVALAKKADPLRQDDTQVKCKETT